MKSNRKKAYEDLVGDSWWPILQPFFDSDEYQQILNKLVDYKNKGLVIQPEFKNVFTTFKNCPYDDVKVVMIMEIGTNKKDNEIIANAIAQAIHEDTKSASTNIWKTTYCLLLPLNLTACNNENHTELWKPFIFHIMKSLQSKPGLIYCFIGKSSKNRWLAVDDSCNDKYYVEHPMQAIVNKRKWDHQEVFEKINRVSTFLNDKPIYK